MWTPPATRAFFLVQFQASGQALSCVRPVDAFEIVEKPAERLAPVSQFIKRIAVVGGRAALGLSPPNSLPVLQIRNKIRTCAGAIVQRPRSLAGLETLAFKGFSLPQPEEFSKAKALPNPGTELTIAAINWILGAC